MYLAAYQDHPLLSLERMRSGIVADISGPGLREETNRGLSADSGGMLKSTLALRMRPS
jgi:hypothetical protein